MNVNYTFLPNPKYEIKPFPYHSEFYFNLVVERIDPTIYHEPEFVLPEGVEEPEEGAEPI